MDLGYTNYYHSVCLMVTLYLIFFFFLHLYLISLIYYINMDLWIFILSCGLTFTTVIYLVGQMVSHGHWEPLWLHPLPLVLFL